MAIKYETVELPAQGTAKNGVKIRLTDSPPAMADVIASGALSEDLTEELAQSLLIAAAHPDDIGKVDKLFEEQAWVAMSLATGYRLSLIKIQSQIMKLTLDAFKVGGNPKA